MFEVPISVSTIEWDNWIFSTLVKLSKIFSLKEILAVLSNTLSVFVNGCVPVYVIDKLSGSFKSLSDVKVGAITVVEGCKEIVSVDPLVTFSL